MRPHESRLCEVEVKRSVDQSYIQHRTITNRASPGRVAGRTSLRYGSGNPVEQAAIATSLVDFGADPRDMFPP
jgi:hypothetical protein